MITFFNIGEILKNMASDSQPDQDLRIMTLTDLTRALSENLLPQLNLDQELKLNRKLIYILSNDPVSEVRSFALKFLPTYMKISNEGIFDLYVGLMEVMLNAKSNPQARDVCGSALLIVVQSMPKGTSPDLVKSMVNLRLNGTCAFELILQDEQYKDILQMGLDVLSEFFMRFGKCLTDEAHLIQPLLLRYIDKETSQTKKKAFTCLGWISVISDDELFNGFIRHLLSRLERDPSNQVVVTVISTLAVLAHFVNYRISQYMPSILLIVEKYVGLDEEDEIKGLCFQLLEPLMDQNLSLAQLEFVVEIALKYIDYYPNFNEDVYAEEAMNSAEEESEEYDMSEDDDMSWKVRLLSARILGTIIRANPSLISLYNERVVPVLVQHFSEPEENVLNEIFNSYTSILNLTRTETDVANLAQLFDTTMATLIRFVAQKKTKASIRLGAINLINSMLFAIRERSSAYADELLPKIELIFSKNPSMALKLAILALLNNYLDVNCARNFYGHTGPILRILLSGLKDSYFKVQSETLRASRGLIKVLVAMQADEFITSYPEYASDVATLYHALMEAFTSGSTDGDIKDNSINTIAHLVLNLNKYLPKEHIDQFITCLSDRLGNEVGQLTAINVIDKLASCTDISLHTIMPKVSLELISFLCRQSLDLRMSSLKALENLVLHHRIVDSNHIEQLMKELSNILNSKSDVQFIASALDAVAVLLDRRPESATVFLDDGINSLFDLANSPSFKGVLANSLSSVLVTLTKNRLISSSAVIERLISQVQAYSADKSPVDLPYYEIARIITQVLAFHENSNDCISNFIRLSREAPEIPIRILMIRTLGEIARNTHHWDQNLQNIKSILMDNLTPNVAENLKTASIHSFGAFLDRHLYNTFAEVVEMLKDGSNVQRVALLAIREFLTARSLSIKDGNLYGTSDVSFAAEYTEQQQGDCILALAKILLDLTAVKEEDAGHIICECLGRIIQLMPSLLFTMRSYLSSESEYTRAIVVSVLKYAILDQEQPAIDKFLQDHLIEFLILVGDPAFEVRLASVISMNFIAHHKPHLIRPLLGDLLPYLYRESGSRDVIKISLGPFFFDQDNSLPIRQAVYECMYTLLETCIDEMDMDQFLEKIKLGLEDFDFDVKILNYLLINRVLKCAPNALLKELDPFIDILQRAITQKPAGNAVKHDIDKNDELIKSAMRTIVCINSLPGIEFNKSWTTFFNQHLKSNPTLYPIYESLLKDT